MEPCIGCGFGSGTDSPPGGVLLRSDHWMMNHCIGPLGLGTLVLAPVRHVERVAELSEVETHELADLMRLAAKVIDEILAPEQTYVCMWSHGPHGPRHLHWIVQPVSRDLVQLHGGKTSEELQLAMFEAQAYPDRVDIEAYCDRVRALL
jgi:ATP adenylyltransferase